MEHLTMDGTGVFLAEADIPMKQLNRSNFVAAPYRGQKGVETVGADAVTGRRFSRLPADGGRRRGQLLHVAQSLVLL